VTGTAARRKRRRSLLLFEATLVLIVVLVTRPLWNSVFDDGPWSVVYDGYGSTSLRHDGAVLEPMAPASTQARDTHAAMVVTRAEYGDLTVTTEMKTDRQLRPGRPNPWEVGWLTWHQTDPQHFYALALKPNGWEVSKQVPGAPGGQQFLASGHTPKFPVGQWHRITVTQDGGDIVVTVNGRYLTHLTDPDPYEHGAIGLYTEDADVIFRNLRVTDGVNTDVRAR
jgi:hypothetical protein